jgi:hypothetical protein
MLIAADFLRDDSVSCILRITIRWRLLLRRSQGKFLDNIVTNGVANDGGDGMEVEFSHDIGTMCFYGFYAQVKSNSYFLTALTLGQ